MKFSVITICYNAASTISRTLESVAAQLYTDIEYIVVDGASTDGTIDIIEKHKSHIAKMISKPDKGIYDAMNKGLDLVTGDIVCFLNADDCYASPHVLKNVARHMALLKLDALIGDVAFFHANNPSKIVRRYRSDKFHPDKFAFGRMPAHPGLFLSRQVIERVGRFRTNYKIAADFELCIRIFSDRTLRYCFLPEVLVNMQTGGVSTSGMRSKILLNQEIMRACRENDIPTNLLKVLIRYPSKLLELVNH